MGLKEKKFIKELKETAIPKIQAAMKECSGKDIEWEIEWDSFADDLKAVRFFENQGPKVILQVVKEICRDEEAKEAILDGFDKIRMKNFDEIDKAKVEFKNNTLTVHGGWGISKYPKTNDIKDALKSDSGMKLQERHFVKEMKDKAIPKLEKRLKERLDMELEWDFDYNSFTGESRAQKFFESQGPNRVLGAILLVGKDDIGREAIQEGIKKVILKNVKGLKKAEYLLEDGTFTVTGDYGASIYPSEPEMKKFLENEL